MRALHTASFRLRPPPLTNTLPSSWLANLLHDHFDSKPTRLYFLYSYNRQLAYHLPSLQLQRYQLPETCFISFAFTRSILKCWDKPGSSYPFLILRFPTATSAQLHISRDFEASDGSILASIPPELLIKILSEVPFSSFLGQNGAILMLRLHLPRSFLFSECQSPHFRWEISSARERIVFANVLVSWISFVTGIVVKVAGYIGIFTSFIGLPFYIASGILHGNGISKPCSLQGVGIPPSCTYGKSSALYSVPCTSIASSDLTAGDEAYFIAWAVGAAWFGQHVLLPLIYLNSCDFYACRRLNFDVRWMNDFNYRCYGCGGTASCTSARFTA